MQFQKEMLKELEGKEIFNQAQEYAFEYIDSVEGRDVYPSSDNIEKLQILNEQLSDAGADPREILSILHNTGSLGTITSTGGMYFGFVTGSAIPISVAAKWLADVWDQCGGLYVISPLNAELELTCERWLKDILNLPESTVAGFVSGASLANFSALTAARYHIYKKQDWDVNKEGLNGAPRIRIITHDHIHSSIKKNIVLLGLGLDNIEFVPCDDQGRMIVDEIPQLDSSCIIILQAGNVNSGSFDNFESICDLANKANAWVHVDGAFGLWAAASITLSHLTKGMEKADSWTVDGHKTLNVPYDSGIVLCKHPGSMANALQATGEYIIYSEKKRDPMVYTPEMSKRSRAIELWAALKYLGKQGVDDMVTMFYNHAVMLADGLKKEGFSILNDIVFNQVLVALEDDAKTKALLTNLQKSRKIWLGGSTWHGKSVIRVSISSWRTSDADIKKTIELFKEAREAL